MVKRSAPIYYAVRVGRKPGIYNTWDECREQTDRYRGGRFKSFPSRSQAAAWIAEGNVDVASTAPVASPVPITSTAPPAISGRNAPPVTLGNTGSRRRFYAVAVGRTPGIFTDYADARASHEGFRGAKHRGFDTVEEAEGYMRLHDVDIFVMPSTGVKEETRNEEVVGSDEESEITDDDSNDDSSIEAPTLTPPTPGSFMMSVYESTQREKNELYGLTSTTIEGYDVAPSSAQPPPSTMRPPPSSYFAHMDDFEPDDAASFDDEFDRYISSQDIKPEPREIKRLRTKAISYELRLHYSSQPSLLNDELVVSEETEAAFRLDVYQNMCRAVRLPVYETERECVRELRKPLVNIVDFIDAARKKRPVKVWTDWKAFCKYTLTPEKCIDKNEAKKNYGFLARLLRKLTRSDADNGQRKRKGAYGAGPSDFGKRIRRG